MIFLLAFVLVLCDAKPGYSGSSNSGNDLGQGANTAGAGGNAYGYAGSFSGDGGFPAGNIPSFVPFIPQFDFSSFFDQLNRQHQEFIQQIQTLAQAQAQAGSSAGTGNIGSGYQGSQGAGGNDGGSYGGGIDLGNRGGFVGGYGGGFSGPDGNSFSFSGPLGGGGEGSGSAIASGSIGPGGIQQTASVFPENPNAPNINTRFGGESGGGGGGFKSVFTSSKSVSSNVDGKPQNYRQASTTVNDNGKVTTYTAHNP